MIPRVALVIGFVVMLAIGGATGGLVAASHDGNFHISVPDSVDIPERTIEVENTNYSVIEVAKLESGTTLNASIEAPSDSEYVLQLRNAENQVVSEVGSLSGDDSASFDTGDLDPSTYYLAVVEESSIRTVHPVIIKAYDVSVSAPDSAEADETITVTATLTDLGSGLTVSSVELLIGDDSESYRWELADSGDEYTVNASLDSLSPGTYSMYITVRGEEEVDGEKLAIGLSDAQSIEVTEPSTPTPTPTATESNGGGGGVGGGGGGGGSTDTPTPTETSTPSPTPTTTTSPTPSPTETTASPTPTTDSTTPTTDSPTPTTDSPTPSPTRSPTPSETSDDGVVTPKTTTAVSTTTTGVTASPGQPGFTFLTLVFALLVGMALLFRRS